RLYEFTKVRLVPALAACVLITSGLIFVSRFSFSIMSAGGWVCPATCLQAINPAQQHSENPAKQPQGLGFKGSQQTAKAEKSACGAGMGRSYSRSSQWTAKPKGECVRSKEAAAEPNSVG